MPLLMRVVLAGVFGLAGVTKLTDRRKTAESFTEFGIPKRMSGLAVSILAALELTCAVAVLPSATALFGAIGVAGLLVIFIAGIVVTLARGKKPACHCFGQITSEPIGPRILVRNTLLLAAAAFVAMDAAPRAAGQASAATWPDAVQSVSQSSLPTLLAVLSIIGLAVVSAALVSVLRQYGRLLIRVERLENEVGVSPEEAPAGLPVGTPAPAFDLASLAGGRVTFADIQTRATSAVLVFIEPGCGPCTDLLPDVAAAQTRAGGTAGTAGTVGRAEVVTKGTLTEDTDTRAGRAGKAGGAGRADVVTNGTTAEDAGTRAGWAGGAGRTDRTIATQESEDADRRAGKAGGAGRAGRTERTQQPEDAYANSNSARVDTLVVVISQGSGHENRSKTDEFGIRDVLLQRKREVAEAYGVIGTPSAVLVRNGVIASPLAAGPEPVRALFNEALRPVDASKVGPGDPVPSLVVKDLDERAVDLRTVTRSRTLLLLWSPGCGYCQQMLANLKAWERRTDPTETALVVVSQGSAAMNREQGLRSAVLLDDSFLIGQTLGASGTPSAVLVENGRVASEVATGASAVFALAESRRQLVHG